MRMIYLEIIGLAFATGGALYGIWTRTPRNNTVATISTVITALGLITATGLAIWKSIDARKNATIANEKRQAELQAVLGNAELSDIEIVWTFNNVPDNVLAIFDVRDMVLEIQIFFGTTNGRGFLLRLELLRPTLGILRAQSRHYCMPLTLESLTKRHFIKVNHWMRHFIDGKKIKLSGATT